MSDSGMSIRSTKTMVSFSLKDATGEGDENQMGLASMHSIRDHHAYQTLNTDGSHLLQNEPETVMHLLLKLLDDGDSVTRDTDRKVRHLQELFDDVEHLRAKVQRADEAKMQAERSNHQLQTRLEIMEENIRELQYTYKQKLDEKPSNDIEERVAKLEESAFDQLVERAPDNQRKRLVSVEDRLEQLESRMIAVQDGPQGLRSKLSKTDFDVSAVEQFPGLMIQIMDTQAKMDLQAISVSALEKSTESIRQDLAQMKQDSAHLPRASDPSGSRPGSRHSGVPVPLPQGNHLDPERAQEYQQAVEDFKKRVEELMRIEPRVMRCEANLGRLTGNLADAQSAANVAKLKAAQAMDEAESAALSAKSSQSSLSRLVNTIEEAFALAQESASKSETAMSLARKAGRTSMDNARLVEEQRDKGISMASTLESAVAKVDRQEMALLGCVTKEELMKRLEESENAAKNSRRRVMAQIEESAFERGRVTAALQAPMVGIERRTSSSPQPGNSFNAGHLGNNQQSSEDQQLLRFSGPPSRQGTETGEQAGDHMHLTRQASLFSKEFQNLTDQLEALDRSVRDMRHLSESLAPKEDLVQASVKITQLSTQLQQFQQRFAAGPMDVRNAIESALETFEERLRMTEEQSSRAEAKVRQDQTKEGLMGDKVNEVRNMVTGLKRRVETVESDMESKVDRDKMESIMSTQSGPMSAVSRLTALASSLPADKIPYSLRPKPGFTGGYGGAMTNSGASLKRVKFGVKTATRFRRASIAEGESLVSPTSSRPTSVQSSTLVEGSESKEATQTGEEGNSSFTSARSLTPSMPQIDEEALAGLLNLSEASMMAVAALDERLALLQGEVAAKVGHQDISAVNKTVEMMQADLERHTEQRINEAVERMGAERHQQTDVMSQSLQSLRMEIGGLLQEMILDDDSQHRKLKEVLEEMLSLKKAAKNSQSEVEVLRKAKFQTPVQMLFPDQYDGGSMIMGIKHWVENEITDMKKQLAATKSVLKLKPDGDDVAKVRDLVEETRRQMFTHQTATNMLVSQLNELSRKADRLVVTVELQSKDQTNLRTQLSNDILKLAVDVTHAVDEAERCKKQTKSASRDIAHLQKAMPQAVKVLRDALKDLKGKSDTRCLAIENNMSGMIKKMEDLEGQATAAFKGIINHDTPLQNMPRAFLSCVRSLEANLDVVLAQANKTEHNVQNLAVKLHRAGCAVTSVVEHMHEGNFHQNNYEEYMKGVVAEDIEDIEHKRMGGQPALKVSRATGNVWSGHIGMPSEDIIRELNEEVFRSMSEAWDAELGCKLRAVPIKADALWVAKVEKDTLLSLKDMDNRLRSIEGAQNSIWKRKAERFELEEVKRMMTQQRMDTHQLRDIVADEVMSPSPTRASTAASPNPGTSSGGYVPGVPKNFPGGYHLRRNYDLASRGSSFFSAPNSPSPQATSKSPVTLPDVASSGISQWSTIPTSPDHPAMLMSRSAAGLRGEDSEDWSAHLGKNKPGSRVAATKEKVGKGLKERPNAESKSSYSQSTGFPLPESHALQDQDIRKSSQHNKRHGRSKSRAGLEHTV